MGKTSVYLWQVSQLVVRNVELRRVRVGVEGDTRDALKSVVRKVEQSDVGTVLESARLDIFDSVVGQINAHQVEVLEGEFLHFGHLVLGHVDQL